MLYEVITQFRQPLKPERLFQPEAARRKPAAGGVVIGTGFAVERRDRRVEFGRRVMLAVRGKKKGRIVDLADVARHMQQQVPVAALFV